MFICKGITKKGVQCKRKLNYNFYCKQHQYQDNLSQMLKMPRDIIFQICKYLDPKSKCFFSYSCKNIYNFLRKNKPMSFNLNTYYDEYIINYIKFKKLDFYTKEIKADGNCGVYTLYEYLRNKFKNINIKKIQKFIKKYINYDYSNKQWIEILDIVKVLDYFGFGVIFKIMNFEENFIYLGYNIKDNYNDNCFINYITELHFDLLIPVKTIIQL